MIASSRAVSDASGWQSTYASETRLEKLQRVATLAMKRSRTDGCNGQISLVQSQIDQLFVAGERLCSPELQNEDPLLRVAMALLVRLAQVESDGFPIASLTQCGSFPVHAVVRKGPLNGATIAAMSSSTVAAIVRSIAQQAVIDCGCIGNHSSYDVQLLAAICLRLHCSNNKGVHARIHERTIENTAAGVDEVNPLACLVADVDPFCETRAAITASLLQTSSKLDNVARATVGMRTYGPTRSCVRRTGRKRKRPRAIAPDAESEAEAEAEAKSAGNAQRKRPRSRSVAMLEPATMQPNAASRSPGDRQQTTHSCGPLGVGVGVGASRQSASTRLRIRHRHPCVDLLETWRRADRSWRQDITSMGSYNARIAALVPRARAMQQVLLDVDRMTRRETEMDTARAISISSPKISVGQDGSLDTKATAPDEAQAARGQLQATSEEEADDDPAETDILDNGSDDMMIAIATLNATLDKEGSEQPGQLDSEDIVTDLKSIHLLEMPTVVGGSKSCPSVAERYRYSRSRERTDVVLAAARWVWEDPEGVVALRRHGGASLEQLRQSAAVTLGQRAMSRSSKRKQQSSQQPGEEAESEAVVPGLNSELATQSALEDAPISGAPPVVPATIDLWVGRSGLHWLQWFVAIKMRAKRLPTITCVCKAVMMSSTGH